MPNALQVFREECTKALGGALDRTFPTWSTKVPRLSVPPDPTFGELSSSISYEIAREAQLSPQQVAEKISKAVDLKDRSIIATVEQVSGYINFRLDYGTAAPIIIDSVYRKGESYGTEKIESPMKISVEHTSANPSGPLTMGHARNAILGDTLARLLKARGHSVNRRFYIDDVGRQVSILAYGYQLLNEPEPKGKADRWLGRLYACTNCALEIEATKRKMKYLGTEPESSDKRSELQKNLDEWVGIAAELQSSDKEIFSMALAAVQKQADPENDVAEIGRRYEDNEPETVKLVRKVTELCLVGIRETLVEIGIFFDTWDWESQLVWMNHVEKTVHRLKKLPFTRLEGLSASIDTNAIVEAHDLREQFGISSNYEVPKLTLTKSDGTTLYPTRDIAYSLLKLEESEKVINVIGNEQTLPQLQIRLALYALGEHKASTNLIHYAYGLVDLPGVKMSKRRAHYITLDEVIEQARNKARETIAKRKEELSGNQSREIVDAIAIGAVKFAMLSVASTKNLTFTWDRVLSLERNSAPFINYAYTRAGSILRKLGEIPEHADLSLLTHALEHVLIFKIGLMPQVFCEAADQLKPEELAAHANSLAEKFHEYYEKVDVIHSEEGVKKARAMLVRAVQIVLRNSMELFGIRLTERM